MFSSPRVHRRSWRTVLIAVAASWFVLPAAQAAEPAHLERCFLDAINDARGDDGVGPLALSPELTEYARSHSGEMASSQDLYHSTPAEVVARLPDDWTAWGENVGYATGSEDCTWLFEGFWESPEHRDNLLNPIFEHVGIGVFVDASDTMWTTHVFFRTSDTSPTTTTSSTSTTTTSTTSAPAPAPSTSPTTTEAANPTTTMPPKAATTTSPPTVPTVAVVTTPTSSGSVPPPSALVAGDRCQTDCPSSDGYGVFLAMVAVAGLGLSWWAVRS